MPNFEFTGETRIRLGVTFKRIRATVDIGFLAKAGDIGGWIEKVNNLSGNAWVSGDASVSGYAEVSGNARVSDNARVFGNARVSGDARVFGNAWVSQPLIAATRSDRYLFFLARHGSETGPFVILAGCRYFTFAEAREHWTKTRGGTLLGDESLALVDHLERMSGLITSSDEASL